MSCRFILDEDRSADFKDFSEEYLKENTSQFYKKLVLTVESTFRNNDLVSQIKDFMYSKENHVLIARLEDDEITFRFKCLSLNSEGNLVLELEEIVKNDIGGIKDGTARIKELLTYGQ